MCFPRPSTVMNFERPNPVLLKDFVDLGEATALGSPKKWPWCGRALLLCVGRAQGPAGRRIFFSQFLWQLPIAKHKTLGILTRNHLV